jgi:putative aminopeptidase FrvX
MDILQEVCSIPTAPFLEHRVIEYAGRFVSKRRKLKLSRDSHGNLLIELAGGGGRQPRWVFGAHIDHPGLITRGMIDQKTVECDFRGFVLAELMKDTRVRFFDAGREVAGRVVEVIADRDSPRARLVRVRVPRPVASHLIGMFDQGEGRVRGKKFYSRAVDDLGGAAAALAMLDQLHRRPPAVPVAVLLTRAEEEGFVGAVAAVSRPRLLRKTDRIIAIECSAMQPFAPQGAGPIIRVGDRTSVFNSALTWFLGQQAEALAKEDKTFRYQRALMPGGTCEATVYDAWGYQTASICVALGNYHNMDRDRKAIGPEYIHVSDWRQMVQLFVRIARHGHEYAGLEPLRARIKGRFEKLKHLL